MNDSSYAGTEKYEIIKDYGTGFEPVAKNEFSVFIKEKREDFEYLYHKEISTRELARMVGIDYEMFRKILNKEKPTKKRDCIIAICVALKMTPGEISTALYLYNYWPGLDDKNEREKYIIAQIGNVTGDVPSVWELDSLLVQRGFPGLDIIDRRAGKKSQEKPDSTAFSHYTVLLQRVRTPVDEMFYYGDPYNSLSTRYDPVNILCTGDMLLCDSLHKVNVHLISSSDGYMSSHVNDSGSKTITYSSIDETGDFKTYFIELNHSVYLEQRRLLGILNDTRNYKIRCSARLIGDSICTFAETFNYSVPELEEYYVLSYSSGRCQLKVFHQSAFMHYYLYPSKFEKHYGKDRPIEIESYDSLDQLDELLNGDGSFPSKRLKIQQRKKAFLELQPVVNDLYNRIKEKKEYILNPECICDGSMDALTYYHIDGDYECGRDEEGMLIDYMHEKTYPLPDGGEILITLDDIYRAFELGFENFQEICRIKSKLGSIEAVI